MFRLLKRFFKPPPARYVGINQSEVTMEIQQLAGICHVANAALCVALGDTSQEPRWEKAPGWQRESVIAGVEAHLENPDITPADSHDRWVAYKMADGWVYGDGKDVEAKTHPNMVAYDKLPEEQKAKDHLFAHIIMVLKPLWDGVNSDGTASLVDTSGADGGPASD